MGRSKSRPRRGDSDQMIPGDIRSLVMGDSGDYAPADTERIRHQYETLTEPADIPGGKTHLVNPQTRQQRSRQAARDRRRPVDYHRQHDVPEQDADTDYDVPRTKVHADLGPEAVAAREAVISEPKYPDAVPVYQVAGPNDQRKIRKLAAYNVNVEPVGTYLPSRLCSVDPDRIEIRLLNEDSSTDIRFSSDLEELSAQDAQGTGAAGAGALLWHGTNSYTDIKTQDEIFAVTTGASSARCSVIIITEEWAV